MERIVGPVSQPMRVVPPGRDRERGGYTLALVFFLCIKRDGDISFFFTWYDLIKLIDDGWWMTGLNYTTLISRGLSLSMHWESLCSPGSIRRDDATILLLLRPTRPISNCLKIQTTSVYSCTSADGDVGLQRIGISWWGIHIYIFIHSIYLKCLCFLNTQAYL